MTTSVEAIYEQGVLRLKEPVALAEGTIVEVTITTREEQTASASLPANILASIAALPMEGNSREFSGRDHDRILYDGEDSR